MPKNQKIEGKGEKLRKNMEKKELKNVSREGGCRKNFSKIHGKKVKRKNNKRKIFIIVVAVTIAVIALIGVSIYLLLPIFAVKKEVTLEAGEKVPEVSYFLRWDWPNAEIASDTSEINTGTVADYKVVIQIRGYEIKSILHVVDTVPPKVVSQNQTVFVNSEIKPENFVTSVEDATPTVVTFKEKPDISTAGTQEVTIQVTDEGGNVSEAVVSMEVVEDTEAPIITGVKDLTVTVGGSVSYKRNVFATDNYDQNVTVNVDTSQVNLNKVGDYTVTYSAIDFSGNEAKETATVHVKPASVDTATEEMVNAEADKILATIINDFMSQYEKAKAIFNWCHNQIGYYDGTPKTNWVQGAYRGLVNRRGDCYVYAMTAKCLLTRAGIKNMDIEKIPSKTRHYWNLIDLGEGWYHFDTCRRSDGSTFFYVTDAKLMAYSNAHHGSHNYDPSKYPHIQ